MKNTKNLSSNKWDQSSFEIASIELDYLNRAVKIYRKYGFVVLKNVIPTDLLKKIRGELLFAFSNNLIKNTTRDLHKFKDGTVSSAHNLADYITSYGELQKLSSIVGVVEGAYGQISTESFNSSYFAKPKLVGLETKPHQDNAFFCMEPPEVATCWMPIETADRSNGALYYYPLTPRLGNVSHSPEGNLGASMCISDALIEEISTSFERVYIELDAGDCVLHSATIIHGSEPNFSSVDRNAINFSIASLNAKRSHKQFSKYQKNLTAFLSAKKLFI